MKRFSRVLTVFLCVVLLMCTFSVGVSAKNGNAYNTYTQWVNQETVNSRAMYENDRYVDSRGMGLTSQVQLDEITDMHCDGTNTYVLDGPEAMLLILDQNLKMIGAPIKNDTLKISDALINKFKDKNQFESNEDDIAIEMDERQMEADENGTVPDFSDLVVTYSLDFTGAQGVFSNGDGTIYICDTEHARILVIDKNSNLLDILLLPDSEIIPDDLKADDGGYKPCKMTKDSKNYLYILSLGSYYGAVMYDENNQFKGFYGANSVGGGVLGMLKKIWDRLFNTNEKKANQRASLPDCFEDLFIDEQDFIYTITNPTNNGIGQLRRMAPNGTNVLYKRGEIEGTTSSTSWDFGDKQVGPLGQQKFSGLVASKNGFVYLVDKTYGHVYFYDKECNLLSVFGASVDSVTEDAKQVGVFQSASAICLLGDELLVSDGPNASITVFRQTDYGKLVMGAQISTLKGDYTQVIDQWKEVLRYDKNSRLAYIGLAKAAFVEGRYQDAIDYAKLGKDRNTYNQAYAYVHKAWLSNNFGWMFVVIILVLVGVVFLLNYTKKRKLRLIKNEKLRVALSSSIHPFDSFNTVKYQNKGSLGLALLFILLFYVSSVLSEEWGGFLYVSPTGYSTWFVLAQTIGLALMWAFCNWGMSVLTEGKAKLRQIFIVTGYACIPMIYNSIFFIIFSHLLPYDSIVVLNAASLIFTLMAAAVLCVGTMVMHDFNFPKFLGTAILTLFAMIILLFIFFMLGIMLQQAWDFVCTAFLEIFYR